MAAGIYNERFLWRKCTKSRNTANGEMVPAWSDNGFLWGYVESVNSQKQNAYGADQTGTSATLHVRQYPGVRAEDRLVSVEWETVWIVDSVKGGDNEIILDVYQFDSITPGEA